MSSNQPVLYQTVRFYSIFGRVVVVHCSFEFEALKGLPGLTHFAFVLACTVSNPLHLSAVNDGRTTLAAAVDSARWQIHYGRRL